MVKSLRWCNNTKVKYIGNAKQLNLSGIGVLDPGDIITVNNTLGQQLIDRMIFEEVKEKVRRTTPKKRQVRKTKPEPPEVQDTSLAIASEFTVNGGET